MKLAFPYGLISPDLNSFREPSLAAFIEANFEQLTPYLNWFTAEIFFHHGVVRSLEFLDLYASKRLSTLKILEELPGSARFISVLLNNAGQNGYVEIQSKSGFIESVRRYMAACALGRGASPAEVAHLCGASMRTIQRLQRAAAS